MAGFADEELAEILEVGEGIAALVFEGLVQGRFEGGSAGGEGIRSDLFDLGSLLKDNRPDAFILRLLQLVALVVIV